MNDTNQLPLKLERKYTLIKEFKSGGQSKTFLVKNESGEIFILKKPKDAFLSTERRFRLKREIEALKYLNGKGVPLLVDYDLEDTFILMEYIKGPTLSEYINGVAIPLLQAKQIVLDILHTIQNAHNLGMVHRDLKPDNVIIGKNNKPVIIDFGICWLASDNKDFKTNVNIELGNRFLRLPELSKGTNVTVSASDITFVVGILFFLLTGKSPNILLDENGNMPHQRGNINMLESLDEWKYLKYIFEKGFTYELSLRYQTTHELVNDINKMSSIENNKNQSVKNELNEFLNSGIVKKREMYIERIKKAHDAFLTKFQETLLPNLVYGGNGPNFIESEMKMETRMFIQKIDSPDPNVMFFIETNFVNNYQVAMTDYGTHKQKYTLEHSINEITKIYDDYSVAGQDTAEIAMSEYLIEIKKIYK